MPNQLLDVPRSIRRGGKLEDVEAAVSDTLKIIDLVCRKLGLSNLGNSRVLDVGCGWRMAKTLLEHDLPIARYVGVDVFAEMIEFLQANVTDERFSFHPLNAHNELYNPDGIPLTEFTDLSLPEESFDVIWLFSVFTHLAPHDYTALLKLLRPYIHPDGKLLFSLFVNETTKAGLGFTDLLSKNWAENPDKLRQSREAYERRSDGREGREPMGFTDFNPNQPLKWALYTRKHALELVEGTGWKIESLNDPEGFIQHYMICTPE